MIEASLIQDVAAYVDGRIARVSLNGGAVLLTEFTLKRAAQGVVELRYYIPAEAVGTVHRIELQDAAGKTLSVNDVQIPITSDTLVLQSVTVEEG